MARGVVWSAGPEGQKVLSMAGGDEAVLERMSEGFVFVLILMPRAQRARCTAVPGPSPKLRLCIDGPTELFIVLTLDELVSVKQFPRNKTLPSYTHSYLHAQILKLSQENSGVRVGLGSDHE